jgi:hypothetical protein
MKNKVRQSENTQYGIGEKSLVVAIRHNRKNRDTKSNDEHDS